MPDLTIKQVYEDYRNLDGELSGHDYILNGPPSKAREDFVSDAWLAICAHVEARCVWTPLGLCGTDFHFKTACGWRYQFTGASPYIVCPFCERKIERKEAK